MSDEMIENLLFINQLNISCKQVDMAWKLTKEQYLVGNGSFLYFGALKFQSYFVARKFFAFMVNVIVSVHSVN